VLSWESGFLKIREKLCHSVDFIFQINSTWRRAHKKVDSPRGLPPEGRPK